MKIEMTYGFYTAISKVMEKAGSLAERGDADALEVLGRLMPVAATLGAQLRRKLAVEIAQMEAKAGPLPEAIGEPQSPKRPTRLQRSACRLRAS
jgi:hypothetical protein